MSVQLTCWVLVAQLAPQEGTLTSGPPEGHTKIWSWREPGQGRKNSPVPLALKSQPLFCLVTQKSDNKIDVQLRGWEGVHSLHPQPGWVPSSLQARSHAAASQQVLKCMFSCWWVSCWFQNSSSHSEFECTWGALLNQPRANCYTGMLYSNGDVLNEKMYLVLFQPFGILPLTNRGPFCSPRSIMKMPVQLKCNQFQLFRSFPFH